MYVYICHAKDKVYMIGTCLQATQIFCARRFVVHICSAPGTLLANCDVYPQTPTTTYQITLSEVNVNDDDDDASD
jgi:hypothetical protein